ncbi:MAG: GAF domain-containing protein [Sphingomonas adhaesiva]|uniref:sensor histidine kinase n=1 Tax=Sphingomonas adhaesiva TaxID=28212 RepID=UPI002FFD5329
MEQRNAILTDTLKRKNAVLEGINRIFREALTAPSVEALGQVCLRVAEDVTGAAFSFMGEVNDESGRLEDVAISERGWGAFTADDPRWPDGRLPVGLHVNGLHGRVILDDASLITNDPGQHPDRIGTPRGHPPLDSFLGVPLRHDGRPIGLIALANRAGGFREEDREAVEELAPAIVQALRSKRGEDALRESEQLRRLSLELVPAMLWRTGPNGENLTSNQQWTAFTGQPETRDIQQFHWLDLIHPDDAASVEEAYRRSYDTGVPLELPYRIRQRCGGYRWFLVRQVPVRDDGGRIAQWFGAATDVHELRMLEERQRVLVGELQHRVRNILTVVRSVFARTAENGESLEDVADHFRGRLDALARAQVIVTQTACQDVDLENLVRDELLSIGVSDGRGLILEGPDVALRPAAAEALGLAVHELSINAVKYGAFKFPDATVCICWSVDNDDRNRPRLTFTWTERGVPALSIKPSCQGFGSELIEEALPYQLGAQTKLEFRGGGVRCTIVLPLADGAGERR